MNETAAVLPKLADFTGMLGQSFRASSPGRGEFATDLVDVRVLTANEHQENFALLFRAPADARAEQGIYDLSTQDDEHMSLFLVPVSRDDGGLYLEAVFNNLVTTTG